MNWYPSYSTCFKNDLNVICRVDILEYLDEQPVIIELIAGDEPIIIQLPEISSISDRVCGSGISINAIYTGNNLEEIRNLYTIDPQGKKIKYYESDLEYPVWVGWLNTEVYSESFSDFSNINLTIEGNDGLSLLDRYDYLSESGTAISGNSYIIDILSTIFEKINIDEYHNLFFCSRLLCEGQPTARILEYLKLQNQNYYDEQGTAMTCREVLNEICKVLNVYCIISQTPHSLHSFPSIFLIDFKEMTFETQTSVYKYQSTGNIFYYDESISGSEFYKEKIVYTDLQIMTDNAELSKKTGVSKIELTYSGYNWEDYFLNNNWDDESNFRTTGYTWDEVVINEGLDDELTFYQTGRIYGYEGIQGINMTSYDDSFEHNISGTTEIGLKQNDSAEFFAMWYHDKTYIHDYPNPVWLGYGLNNIRIYTDPADFNLYGINGNFLKITCQAKILMRSQFYNEKTEDGDNFQVGKCELKTNVTIKKTGESDLNIPLFLVYNQFESDVKPREADEDFENTWVELTGYLYITGTTSGQISIQIYDYIHTSYLQGDYHNWWRGENAFQIEQIWIKNIKCIAVNELKEIANEDIKTTIYSTDKYESKSSLTIKHGDSSDACMCHRGAILTSGETLATNFYRKNGDGLKYNLNDLLCKLNEAEVMDSRYLLSDSYTSDYICFDKDFQAFNSLTFVKNPYLPDIIFMIKGGDYYARSKILEVNLQEIKNEDEITIS
jgi:hypothetical protein